jgi:hypothetical protein
MDVQFLNLLTLFLNRLGTWWLDKMTLAEFCCNREIDSLDCIHIGMLHVPRETIYQRCAAFNIECHSSDDTNVYELVLSNKRIEIYNYCPLNKYYYSGKVYKSWIQCDEETASEIRKKNPFMAATGLWKVAIDPVYPIEFFLPYQCGCVLDCVEPEWFKKIERKPTIWNIHDLFFDEARTKNGVELLSQLYECGLKAGIADAMFIGYGTALGAVRHGGFIPNDRDMDMCILADRITKENALAYVEECKAAKLGEYRWRTPMVRSDTGMPLWFSLGPKNPVSDNGVKCCQWFWFKYGGYYWHSKGGLWVSPSKFNPHKTNYAPTDAAIAKGVPADCVDNLIEFPFLGLPVLLPQTTGACLDCWYPGWPVPREGASAHTHILVVGDWNDEKTWRIS